MQIELVLVVLVLVTLVVVEVLIEDRIGLKRLFRGSARRAIIQEKGESQLAS